MSYTTHTEPKQTKPFFMVARLGGGSPTQAHSSFSDAMIEANRLAEKHAGATFYVLEAAAMITSKVVIERTMLK